MTNQAAVVEAVEVVELSKAEKSQLIFAEESAKGDDKLRSRCIARFVNELSMKSPGASTYFQNCKTRAAGGKVKNYSAKKEQPTTVDVNEEVVPDVFEVKLLDGTIQCFLSQQEADLFIEGNASIVDPDQSDKADDSEVA